MSLIKTAKKLVFSVLKMDNWSTYVPGIQFLHLLGKNDDNAFAKAARNG